MVSALISRVVILVFGTLYPAYSSYKAVKNKNVKEYVKWMMYWIVFALFTSVETFADVLVSWFPFYYELKIAFVIWLLSPATKGSSVLYRKFVHPELMKRENEIDLTLERVKSQGYTALVNVGQQGLNFAVQKAITGQNKVMENLMKKSFSLGDISQQHTGATRVMYQPPTTERIPEAADETDYSSAGVPAPALLEVNTVQGGDTATSHSDHIDNTPLLSQPVPPPQELTPSRSGYNLRSHEYHTGDTSEGHAPHKYHHSEEFPDEVQDSKDNGKQLITTSKVESVSSLTVKSSLTNRRPRSRSAGRRRKVASNIKARK